MADEAQPSPSGTPSPNDGTHGAAQTAAAAEPLHRLNNTHESQILAQRSPPGSVKSQIQLRPTVLRVDGGGSGSGDNDEQDEEAGGLARAACASGDGAKFRSSAVRNGKHIATVSRGMDDDDDDDDDDDNEQAPLTRVEVGGSAWDESDDEDDDADLGSHNAHTRRADGSHRRPPMSQRHSSRQRKRLPHGGVDHSYLASLRPNTQRIRQWLVRLTKSPSNQASLSAPHVAANLFSASLNPAVLLSMPAYFERTGIAPGVIGLVVVATLAGAGGGLWVVLARYVGGSNIEAITAASCGRNTRWKGNIGRAIAGMMVASYATGTAVIAYFALADLLLQVFFHYSPRGIPLHNRLFVTIVIGGLVTTPLIIYPLAKRNLIRLSTFVALLCYPCTLGILYTYIYSQDQSMIPLEPASAPRLNPLHPPSIWAPFSLLPLLSLSASPLQIIAHNRSLRRQGISGSNVTAFLAAQAAQTLAAVGVAVAFGVGVGTQGMNRRLGLEAHPNLFTTLPLTDNLNLARVLFIAILSSHLALCLVTVRSAWARLLHLFNANPFRGRGTQATAEGDASDAPNASGSHAPATASSADAMEVGGSRDQQTPQAAAKKKRARTWTRPARNALAGLLLWGLTAFTAYWSGVGGFHRRKGDPQGSHPNDEAVEANFTRSEEVLGLLGAGVGFVLPAIVWIILFHVRQPRAILPPFAADMARQASAWFLGPLSVLALRKRRRDADANASAEREPLLGGDDDDQGDRVPTSADYRASLDAAPHGDGGGDVGRTMPSWRTERQEGSNDNMRRYHEDRARYIGSSNTHVHDTDEATRILLARKERELQRRSRGRRRYQDLIVLAGILPLGVSLIVLGALDLRHGGW